MSDWQWRSNARQALNKIRAAVNEGIDAGAKVVFDDSQAKVPVDTGELKASGHIVANGFERTIRYNDPVAVIVHEDMVVNHQNGQAKYLEAAMNEKRDEARQKIIDTIRTEMQG